MSNHFHLVVYYDPLACNTWSAEEIASRWTAAFPPMRDGQVDMNLQAMRRDALLCRPHEIERLRKVLGSLSGFMKHLKQPIACRANQEDGCRGHFFESRFYSGALLDDASVCAAMAYVDLNPIRARISDSLEASVDASIASRLQALANTPERIDRAMMPIVSGLEPEQNSEEGADYEISAAEKARKDVYRPLTLREYLELLDIQVRHARGEIIASVDDRRWLARVDVIRRRQRAFGAAAVLTPWLAKRRFRRTERSTEP
ncbi:MAG: hypothetical protein KDK91_09865 [Gammaproteobacteria bacterium]|nr:hypothetical protein [Gammaproteobacteria bacterium]